MKYKQLGTLETKVSEICLGTMTWGQQNSQNEGFEQMDYAVEQGVNFFDTAELYAIPQSAETQGKTEEIIGNWFEKTGKRKDIVLATKVSGAGIAHIRDGAPISSETIKEAVAGSLKRLKTDYIDLYQLHWPNRGSYHFAQLFDYDASAQSKQGYDDNFLEVLNTLNDLRKEGVINQVGLSNETAWGAMKYLQLARENNFPEMVSVQNEYSLLYRRFDTHMAEVAHHEGVGLLAYSSLAFGVLTGKYQNGVIPEGSRGAIYKGMGNRLCEKSLSATQKYLEIAEKHELDPSQMALAFVLSRPFTTSVIIGATKMDQLATNIASKDVVLSDEVLADIQDVYRQYPICY